MTSVGPLPEEFIEAMGGEEEARETQATIAAVASLLTVNFMYTTATEGSDQEKSSEDALAEMVETLSRKPDKVEEILPLLLGIVTHMRMGHPFAEFFTRAGVNIPLFMNSRTGEHV